MTTRPHGFSWALVPLVAVLLAASPPAPTMHLVKGFTVGAKPAGFTYPKDATWALTAPFVRLNTNRYMLVGGPLWVWSDRTRSASKNAFPVLDLVGRQISFPTAVLGESLPKNSDLVHYNADSQQAGFTAKGDEQAGRWPYGYAHWDLKTDTIDWTQPLVELNAHEYVVSLGISPDERFFYFMTAPLKANPDTTPTATLARLDLTSRTVDWRHAVPLPVRQGHALRSPDAYVSADYRKIALVEHSEPADGRVTPPPQAFVVDVPARRHFAVTIPITPYGVAFDRQNRYLAIGSNVEGKVYRYDLAKQKQDTVVASVGRIHRLALSGDNTRLYVLPKGDTIDVRAWPSLARIRTLPVSAVAKGQTFIDPEGMGLTADGRIGLLPRTKAPYGFPDDVGFYSVAF